MSRSNPSDNQPNPSTRWFDWAGGNNGGTVTFYDKEAKSNRTCDLPFTFIVLDELAKVTGWHDPSESGIYSNEVRDTRQEVMLVRSFKGGELAVGLYASIRDRVGNLGGKFQSSIYVGYRDGESLRLGNIGFTGAALQAWMEFKRANRSEIYKQAVSITGYTEGKKGSVTYRVPMFKLKAIGEATEAEAIELDRELQAYLKGYLSRTREDQTQQAAKVVSEAAPVPTGREAMEERMAQENAGIPRDPYPALRGDEPPPPNAPEGPPPTKRPAAADFDDEIPF
jgi:hypothetical protein